MSLKTAYAYEAGQWDAWAVFTKQAVMRFTPTAPRPRMQPALQQMQAKPAGSSVSLGTVKPTPAATTTPATGGFWQGMKEQLPGVALTAAIPMAMNAFSGPSQPQQQY